MCRRSFSCSGVSVAPSVPTICPTAFRAGDTVVFTRAYPDFPVADGWTFTYTLNGASKATGAVSVASGTHAQVTLSSTLTKDLLPGSYVFLVRATLSGASYTAESGIVTIHANIEAATAGALESTDEAELRVLNAAILSRATNDHKSYAIGDRSLDREELQTLIEWRDRLRAKIQRRRNGGKQAMAGVHFVRRGLP